MLEHKKTKLVDALKKLVTGKDPSFIPYDFENDWENHFQIWFYDPFEFTYIVIGKENFVVNVSDKDDEALLQELRNKFDTANKFSLNPENEFLEHLKAIEYEFFAECWDKLQRELSGTLRCFLVQYGVLKGFDVNRRLRIDGEDIGRILADLR